MGALAVSVRSRGRSPAGEPEVEDLQVSRRRHHQVPGLQVSVQDALLVSRGQPAGRLLGEPDHLRLRHGAAAKDGIERLARDVLHDQKIEPLGGVEVVDDGHVGMAQTREAERLAAEPPARGITCRCGGGKELDGDIPLEMLVAGAVDDTHATGPDAFDDAVVREDLAEGLVHEGEDGSEALEGEGERDRERRGTGGEREREGDRKGGVSRRATSAEEGCSGNPSERCRSRAPRSASPRATRSGAASPLSRGPHPP